MLFTVNEGGSRDALVPLAPQEGIFVDGLLDEFKEGVVNLTSAQMGTEDNGWQRISGSFLMIGIGAVATMLMGGIQINYERSGNGFSFKMQSALTLQNIDVTLTDPHGASVRLVANFNDSDNGPLVLPIPGGIDLDPQAASIEVSLDVVQADYEAATADQSKLLVTA